MSNLICGVLRSRLKGQSFADPELERQYTCDYRMSGVRVGYLFSWMAALSFVAFSLVEYFVLERGVDHPIQHQRAFMIVVFALIGLHAKFHEALYERIYQWVVPLLMFLYAVAILHFESHTQLAGHPEFFYLSVTSTCILLTIAAYYFMRLPIGVALLLSLSLAAATFYAIRTSGVFEAMAAGRMLTYIGVANAVGLWIRIMFDIRERWIFQQNHVKTRLLAMLSHEIRTPMTTVARLMGLVRRDLDGQLSEKRLATFQHVEHACAYLVDTLDDLLHFSAASGDPSQQAPLNAFQLGELVRECGEVVALSAQDKGLSLDIDTAQVQPVVVLGRSHYIKRAVLNLLGNAIKFTNSGGITLHASLRTEEAGQAQLIIAVSDTGIGIAPQEHANIFRLFYQVDSSNSRRFGGTGLGLGISRGLIEAMGGSIDVQSAVGRGTTFTIRVRLPVVQQRPQGARDADAASPALTGQQMPGA